MSVNRTTLLSRMKRFGIDRREFCGLRICRDSPTPHGIAALANERASLREGDFTPASRSQSIVECLVETATAER
jgi:hypothetical protein